MSTSSLLVAAVIFQSGLCGDFEVRLRNCVDERRPSVSQSSTLCHLVAKCDFAVFQTSVVFFWSFFFVLLLGHHG